MICGGILWGPIAIFNSLKYQKLFTNFTAMYRRNSLSRWKKFWKACSISQATDVKYWFLRTLQDRFPREHCRHAEEWTRATRQCVNCAPPLSDIIFPGFYLHLGSVVAPHLSIARMKCMLSLCFIYSVSKVLSFEWNLTVWQERSGRLRRWRRQWKMKLDRKKKDWVRVR